MKTIVNTLANCKIQYNGNIFVEQSANTTISVNRNMANFHYTES